MLGGFDILTIVIVLLAVTLYLGVKTVPQGYNWTVERFGRYTRLLTPGRSWHPAPSCCGSAFPPFWSA
jgi:regulator of protease activity HflC (stomatin/prohibitin superfamily)